jgi:hypothetical protein
MPATAPGSDPAAPHDPTRAKRSFWPNFFSQLVARLQWNPMASALTADAAAWPELPPDVAAVS